MEKRIFWFIWLVCNTLLAVIIISAWNLGQNFYYECLAPSCAVPMWGIILSTGALSTILIFLSLFAAQQKRALDTPSAVSSQNNSDETACQ